MAVATRDIAQPFINREADVGPITAARHRRIALLYAAMLVAGLMPIVLRLSPAAQAAGLGLWMPGGGFIAVGGWAILLFPVTVALFGLALFAWFGSGMAIAPIIVWLGAALMAEGMAGDAIWPGAPFALAAGLAGIGVYAYRTHRTRKTAGLAKLEARNRCLPEAIVEAAAVAAPAPPAAERELSVEELAAVRYALDRALQPIGRIDGFDQVDQFQTAALRYQINSLGYLLGMVQCNYAPSFHGYLSQAQRNLIELYLRRRIWGYWVYESAWGHLNITNPDPVAIDNIMLTGWLGVQLCIYMSNTGDRRYAAPGSLPFRLNRHRVFHHDIHSIAQSVLKNFLDSEFCLYSCEPNWIYPICNHYGMTALAIHDRLFGTAHMPATLDRWLRGLDAEFTDYSGSVIGLRSSLTGIGFPFPGAELVLAQFENCFAPERAERMWAIGRHELKGSLKPGAAGASRIVLKGRGFDFGNYGPGFGGAYAMIMDCAREFGDYATADAAQRALDEDCGRAADGGILRYSKMSNLSNITAVRARIHRCGDFRNTVMQGPPESSLRGPLLAGAGYPEVLVARAFSDGGDLELVLYPGTAPGPQSLKIERLRPGAKYTMRNGADRSFTADAGGAASVDIDLRGRTPLHIVPAN